MGSRAPKILISGGGTGGHVFPAIAIANELKSMNPATEFQFVGAQGKLEMQKVPAAGFPIEGLVVSGFQRNLSLRNLTFPFKLLGSIYRAFSIVSKFRPDVAIGVGGYASGPTLFAAAMKGIPCVLQEQNSYAGVTNKILSRWASKICVAYDGMEKFFTKNKLILTGNPVREAIKKANVSRLEGLSSYGLSPEKATLFVMGGSLGARTINHAMASCLQILVDKDIQVIWQTGKLYEKYGQEIAAPFGEAVKATAFITEMEKAYAAADMIVSRAGALSISELCLVGKPTILVPSPNVSEDHQTQNAMALVKHNAAILVKDIEAKERLGQVVCELHNDNNQKATLAENILKLARPEAGRDIAFEVLKLIEKP